ncbi:hypothetical protein GZ78_17965 [Endozoicomonas numazuensis]|uniref:Uncharacterized protein n=1 Tax=Endozoicomonas numazuensis TaxID=1137799 RepID=A0A081NGP1_9GAMM|nr:hypothetical protein GZ78_17965 [Endozoicomonas numazuensis]
MHYAELIDDGPNQLVPAEEKSKDSRRPQNKKPAGKFQKARGGQWDNRAPRKKPSTRSKRR